MRFPYVHDRSRLAEDSSGVKHISRRYKGFPLLSIILSFNVTTILIGGFMLSLTFTILFALIFWAIDQDCYVASDVTMGKEGVTFQKMFALSAQTFTTVGYGGIYVRCWHTNVLVLLEWFLSLSIGGVIMGVLIINLLSPAPMIRWSKKILLTNWRVSNIYYPTLHQSSSDAGDIEQSLQLSSQKGYGSPMKALCLRTISEANYQITSFKIEAVAYILRVNQDANPTGTFIVPLKLLRSENVLYHQFGACHIIDDTSPLHRLLRDDKLGSIDRIVCKATYHDPRFKADVVSYHTYWSKDIEKDAVFRPMVQAGPGEDVHMSWNNRTYDHADMDAYERQCDSDVLPSHPFPTGIC